MARWQVEVSSPVSGTVTHVHRGAGQKVKPYDPVATVESEGLRVAVKAGEAGVIEEVHADVGVYVEPGYVLAVVATDAEPKDRPEVVPPKPLAVRCTHCGCDELRPGFLEDQGQSSGGYARWIEGPLELGIFGGARRLGKRRHEIEAYRCSSCSHLELFAIDPGP